MASESSLFKDVDKDFLMCSICRDIYKHPKQLKCMHNFCQICLEGLIKKGTTGKVRCSICREEVELDVDKVSEIEDNIFLRNLCELYTVVNLNTIDVQCSFCSEPLYKEDASCCIDCSDNLCGKCTKTHTLTRLTRNHQVILMSEIETETLVRKTRDQKCKMLCQKHHFEYFCQTCQLPVCYHCHMTNQKGHVLLSLQEGAMKVKTNIIEEINKLEQIIPSFEKHISIANEAERNLIESLEKTKNDIRATTKSLIEEIETHAKELIERVDKKAEAIQKIIEHHRESAEIKVESSTGINKFSRNLCKHGLDAEIMSSNKDLLRRMKELQEDMKDLVGTGELRFFEQKEFKLGTVQECQLKKREHILKDYAEHEIAVDHRVKRGPNWQGGDDYDGGVQNTNNTVRSIKRSIFYGSLHVEVYFPKSKKYYEIDKVRKVEMNPGKYWLQPSDKYGNYVNRLECYVKRSMEIGDEVKRGLNWPPSWTAQDNNGKNIGKIAGINRDNQGIATAVVEFGPAPYDAVKCPMYSGTYYLLPLKPFRMINWVEF